MRHRKTLIKLIIILLIIIPLLITWNVIKHNIPLTEEAVTSENIDDTYNEELQAQMDEYAKKQTEEEAKRLEAERKEKERLQRLSNPKLIILELEKVSKLITYEGKVTFKNQFINKSFMAKKTIDLDITYNFGIGMNLNAIEVGDIVEDTVVIQIPKDQLVLMYLDNIPEQTIINHSRTMFAKQYKPEEVNMIINFAKEKTTEQLNSTEELFVKADESLKDTLEDMILKLGYRKIIFEEM